MARQKYPNIVFIIADQLKWSALRMYSEIGIETPSLERLAREGVRFEHAITPHPLCVPARTSMMTARYPHSTGCRRNETLMPPGEPHAFRLWKELGYTTGLIGKNHCFIQRSDLETLDVRCEISHGGLPKSNYLGEIQGNKGMEWVVPEDVINESHSTRRAMPGGSGNTAFAVSDHPIEGYSSYAITSQAEAFLERVAKGDAFDGAAPGGSQQRPFALLVSYPDPHHPIEAPRRYADLFPPESVKLPPTRDGEFDDPLAPERNRVLYEMLNVENNSEDEVRGFVSVYQAMTRFVDDGIGRILDKLEALGIRDDTIIVFTADHGDFAGEHNMTGKGGVFYDSLVRVPLIISWTGGGVPHGAVDGSLGSTLDVLPTLVQLGGVADFTQSEPVAPGNDIPPAGPRIVTEDRSDLISPETFRRFQGKPLPTVTSVPGRTAAFSEYGTGGPPFTLDLLNGLPDRHGMTAILDSLWAREAEGRRKMVRTARWKFVTDPALPLNGALYPSGAAPGDELYDLQNDPWELWNVADRPEHALVVSEMRALLAGWLAETEEATPVPLPETIGRGPKPVIDVSR